MATRIGDKVQSMVVGVVAAVVLLLVGVALGPTVLEATADINATALADVPMGGVIVLLATYIGFFYYLGIVLASLATIWALTRTGR